MAWGVRRGQRRTPAGVVTQLRKHPGERYRVRESASQRLSGTWNPGKPFGSGNIYGYGTGSYWLEGDQVHLEWHPKKGSSEHFVGPAPTVQTVSRSSRALRGLIAALGIYLAAAVVGFLLAYELSSGSSTYRSGIGAFGAMAGYLAAYVVAIVVVAVVRSRRHRA
jgi:hypothetical protein